MSALTRLLGLGGRSAGFDAAYAPARPVYAVGDIHGCAELLADLLSQIIEDAGRRGGAAEIVFLGDYIDRGAGTRTVLDLLMEIERTRPLIPVFLAGNHESMLLRFLEDPVKHRRWLRHGGLQTLESYGVPAEEGARADEVLMQIAARLGEAMGPHRDFLARTANWHRNGNLVFAHAAADPALPPEEQERGVLLWGHPEFRKRCRTDGLWVVHGHTVVDVPEISAGRMALDTGAYVSGILTAARFSSGNVEFFTACT